MGQYVLWFVTEFEPRFMGLMFLIGALGIALVKLFPESKKS